MTRVSAGVGVQSTGTRQVHPFRDPCMSGAGMKMGWDERQAELNF
jgi:hypothetical protein